MAEAEITIAEVAVKVPQPFTEGHVCNGFEAGALNQLTCENLRNNLREAVKKAVTEGKSAGAIQSLVSDYAGKYKFGERKGGGFRTADPIMAEAMDDAKKRVKRAILKAGKPLKAFTSKDISERARKLIADHPKLMDKAKKVVQAREAEMDSIVADI